MATSLHDSNSQKGDAIQEILKSGCGLTAVKPKVGEETIVRIIPETDGNGNPVPMIAGHDANGPLFSNLTTEPLVLFAGAMTKFHGLIRPSDPGLHDMPEPDLPFSGLYIKLKGDMNKKRVPVDQYMVVNELLTKPANGSAQLAQVQNHVLAQVCVMQLNGKAVNPPATKQVMVLGKSAKMALTACLLEAAKNRVDVFDPKGGFLLKIYGTPKVNNAVQNFIIEPAGQIEIPEGAWKNQFVPWDQCLKRYSYDELIHKMVAAYGAGVVAMKPSFKEAMDRLGIKYGTTSYSMPAAPGASAPTGSAPAASSGWGATAPSTATPSFAPTQSAPANGGWGTPAATTQSAPAAPASAPTSGGWGTAPAASGWGSAPAAQSAPIPMPAVSTPPATTGTPDISELEKAYAAELAKKNTK